MDHELRPGFLSRHDTALLLVRCTTFNMRKGTNSERKALFSMLFSQSTIGLSSTCLFGKSILVHGTSGCFYCIDDDKTFPHLFLYFLLFGKEFLIVFLALGKFTRCDGKHFSLGVFYRHFRGWVLHFLGREAFDSIV